MDIFPEMRKFFRLSYFDKKKIKRWFFLIQSDFWNRKRKTFLDSFWDIWCQKNKFHGEKWGKINPMKNPQNPRGLQKKPCGEISHVGIFLPICMLKLCFFLFPISYNVGFKTPYTVNYKSLVVQNFSIKLDFSSLL